MTPREIRLPLYVGWEISERERMMRSDWLTALAATLTAVFLVPISAVAAPDLIDVCHHTADDAPDEREWRHLRVNANSVERLLSHGDGQPGGEVPGTDGGFVFDDHCDPKPAGSTVPPETDEPSESPTPPNSSELIFAVAYSDMDPNDGGYNPDVDVLIAKLIDGPDEASDGLPGVGDLIITGQYPEDFVPSEFGAFTVGEHTVTNFGMGLDYLCRVESGDGTFVWSSGQGGFDQYQEWSSGEALTRFYDDRSTATAEQDEISVNSTSPSEPASDVATLSGSDLSDQMFIDVEADCLP